MRVKGDLTNMKLDSQKQRIGHKNNFKDHTGQTFLKFDDSDKHRPKNPRSSLNLKV